MISKFAPARRLPALALSLLGALALFPHTSSAAVIEVRVCAYPFPPYFDTDNGITARALALFNQNQHTYHFTIVSTSARRRYEDLISGFCDAILFEDPRWEWNDLKVQTGKVLVEDREVYVARRSNATDHSYFDHPEQLSLIGVMGYHYGFAQFNADPDYLRRRYRTLLVKEVRLVIPKLIEGYGDAGLVPLSYLHRQQQAQPELRQTLVVGEHADQDYHLASIFREAGPITPKAFDNLIQAMEANGSWTAFLKQEKLLEDTAH